MTRTTPIDAILEGDALTRLKELPDESVDCCITSPPYFGLRDYGTAKWEGGDPECKHVVGNQVQDTKAKGAITSGVRPGCDASKCKICGAIRVDGQIGLEESPEAYVSKLVEVFREVRRVLKKEGTLWLNLGDSFASGKGTCFNPGGGSSSLGKSRKEAGAHPLDRGNISDLRASGLKPKDLIGIPWMVAFALRADGWYLRSDIIWHKPNCMPESCKDRPTKSHEYIFLLSKSQKYYYDGDAIKESQSGTIHKARTFGAKNQIGTKRNDIGRTFEDNGDRNKRTVWTVATKPYSEAHFATFPPALIEPCILAGTSEKGVCPVCGKPWIRQVEHKNMVIRKTDRMADLGEFGRTQSSGTMLSPPETKTTGWLPSCSCSCDPVPAVVLDPFFGAGTTGLVAKKLGRCFIGIELNEAYIGMAQKRIAAVPARLDRWAEAV